jgi:hypothetical protein
MLDEGPADAAAGAVGMDGDLLDVQRAVQVVRHQVGDGHVRLVHGHPGEPGRPVPVEPVQGERLVLRDGPHAGLGEPAPGGALDDLQQGEFVRADGSDRHRAILLEEEWRLHRLSGRGR